MKPQTLKRLKLEIKTVSDYSLAQFFAVVLEELRKRNPKRKQLPKHQGFWEKKDCDPIRGY